MDYLGKDGWTFNFVGHSRNRVCVAITKCILFLYVMPD